MLGCTSGMVNRGLINGAGFVPHVPLTAAPETPHGEPICVVSAFPAKLAHALSLRASGANRRVGPEDFFHGSGLPLLAVSVLTPGVSVVSCRLNEERAQNLVQVIEQAYDLIGKRAPLAKRRAFWESYQHSLLVSPGFLRRR